MKHALAALLMVALLTGGCASFRYAVEQVPERTQAMWDDPVRREHFLTQVQLEWSTASVAMTCAVLVPFPFNLGVCPLVAVVYNFGAYEFVLEPWSRELVKEGKPSKVGPYYERGPQDGELFKCNVLVEYCDRWPYIHAPVHNQ